MSNAMIGELRVKDQLRGRRRIYTTAKQVDRNNIIEVLSDAIGIHELNQMEIQYLIDYELGDQPLEREKTIRSDIDIRISENAANYVVEFKKGYFWGIPPVLIQHADKEMRKSDEKSDDIGISALNEMMLNGLDIAYENQILGDFVEKCGIGHRLVDVKTEFDDEESKYALVNLYALDSRYAFCVYNNGVGQKKVLGVTYVEEDDNKYHFTCYTDSKVFDITGLGAEAVIVETTNVLGRIPVIEYNRAIDRTGCFERHISYMDGLNVLVSDLANDTAQNVQTIWWGNDIAFQQNADGSADKPESGDWLLTYSGTDKNPKVQPLSSGLNTASTLDAISFEWNRILQKCKVPIQQETTGGGSTGTATSMASGWQTAEVDALREESVISRGMKEELRLILRAIKLVPTKVLEAESPLRTVRAADVDFHFNRNRNYDLSIKANTLATLINAGMHGRHAIKLSEISPDAETVWNDSAEIIQAKQHKMFADNPTSGSDNTDLSADTVNEDRTLQDSSDQTSNSPYLGTINTNQN